MNEIINSLLEIKKIESQITDYKKEKTEVESNYIQPVYSDNLKMELEKVKFDNLNYNPPTDILVKPYEDLKKSIGTICEGAGMQLDIYDIKKNNIDIQIELTEYINAFTEYCNKYNTSVDVTAILGGPEDSVIEMLKNNQLYNPRFTDNIYMDEATDVLKDKMDVIREEISKNFDLETANLGTTLIEARNNLYKKLIEIAETVGTVDNIKKDSLSIWKPASTVQSGGGVEAIVTYPYTLFQLTPETITQYLHMSSVLYCLLDTISPPQFLTTLDDILEVKTSLDTTREFSEKLGMIIEKIPELNKFLPSCFQAEMKEIVDNLAFIQVNLQQIQDVIKAYNNAIANATYQDKIVKLKNEAETKTKQKIEEDENNKKITEVNKLLKNIYLIRVKISDTTFPNKSQRNTEITIFAKKNASGSYQSLNGKINYSPSGWFGNKICIVMDANLYITNKIKMFEITYCDITGKTTQIKVKDITNNFGEIILKFDNNQVKLSECYFTCEQAGFFLGYNKDTIEGDCERLTFHGFFLGKLDGDEKYYPGYYLIDKKYKFFAFPDVYKSTESFKNNYTWKDFSNIKGKFLTYNATNGETSGEVTNYFTNEKNELAGFVINDEKIDIKDVYADLEKFKAIYDGYPKTLLFYSLLTEEINKTPNFYCNNTIYIPGYKKSTDEVKNFPLVDDQTLIIEDNIIRNIKLKVNEPLDFEMDYFDENNFKTGKLTMIKQENDDCIFVIDTKEMKDNCFFTKKQWLKIESRESEYVPENFFIGFYDLSNINIKQKFSDSGIIMDVRPIYLPGEYYKSSSDSSIYYKFFMDETDDPKPIIDEYKSAFEHFDTLKKGMVSYFGSSIEVGEGYFNGDNFTIGVDEIDKNNVFIEQYQILSFYPNLIGVKNLRYMTFDEKFEKSKGLSGIERNLIVHTPKINESLPNGTYFEITQKQNGMDIKCNLNSTTENTIKVTQDGITFLPITNIIVVTEFTSGTSEYLFIHDTDKNVKPDDIFLYKTEYNKLLGSETPNENGLVQFYLQRNSNIAPSFDSSADFTSKPNVFLPGYYSVNKAQLFCMTDKIDYRTPQDNITLISDLTHSKRMATLSNEKSGNIKSYKCNDFDEIEYITTSRESDIDIKTCYVKDKNISDFYPKYDSLEKFLITNNVCLYEIDINDTKFKDFNEVKRPITILVVGNSKGRTIYQNNKFNITYSNLAKDDSNKPYNVIDLINTRKLSTCQNIILDTVQKIETMEITHINYDKNNSQIKFDGFDLQNIYFTAEQINSKTILKENAELNFRMFMINSLTTPDLAGLLTSYNIKSDELLFLPGYFYTDGAVDKMKLLIDGAIEVVMTNYQSKEKKTNLEIDPTNKWELINNDTVYNNYDFVYKNNVITNIKVSGISIDIENIYMKITPPMVVINNIPLNLMPDSDFDTWIKDAKNSNRIESILQMPVDEFSKLSSGILNIIVDNANLSTYVITTDNIEILSNNVLFQKLINKLSPTQMTQLITGVNDATKLQQIQQKDSSLLINNLNKLQGLEIAEVNNVLEGLSDTDINKLVNTSPESVANLARLPDMSYQDIAANADKLRPKYLKLLISKLDAAAVTLLMQRIKLTEDQLTAIDSILSPTDKTILADNMASKLSGQQLASLLENTPFHEIYAILNKAKPDEIVNALNKDPELIIKINDTPANADALINKLIAAGVGEKLSANVVTKLTNPGVINNIPLDLATLKMMQPDEIARREGIGIIDKDALTTSLATSLAADAKLELDGEKIAALKLSKDNYKTINEAITKENLVFLNAKQINELTRQLVTVTDINEFITNVLNKLDIDDLKKLSEDAKTAYKEKFGEKWEEFIEGKMNTIEPTAVNSLINFNGAPDTMEKLVDNLTIQKKESFARAITEDQILKLTAESINAIEANLYPAECKIIYDKVINKNALTPEQFGALIKKFSGNDWATAIRSVNKINYIIGAFNSLNPNEIMLKKNEMTDQELFKWMVMKTYTKIYMVNKDIINTIKNIDDRIFYLDSDNVRNINNVTNNKLNTLDTEQKQAIRNIIRDSDLNLLDHDKKIALGYTFTPEKTGFISNYPAKYTKGGTKRSKVKQNKTRRL